MNSQPLSKKEINDQKRQEKLAMKESAVQKRYMKKIALLAVVVSISVASIVGITWIIATNPSVPESDIITRDGIHWHPQLAIYVKGVKQDIPPNIGMGASEQPIHTHDDSNQGILHLEFGGLVRKQDVMLGQFFKTWGKDMHSFGTNMTMTVNGKENTEYENYVMKENDKIELHFE